MHTALNTVVKFRAHHIRNAFIYLDYLTNMKYRRLYHRWEKLPNDKLFPITYINSSLLAISLPQTLKACLRLSRLASDSLMTADMYSSIYVQSGSPDVSTGKRKESPTIDFMDIESPHEYF